MKNITVCLAFMLLCQFSVFSQFVTVKDGKFKLGEDDFYFQGGNIHHIAYDKGPDPGTNNGGPTNFSYEDIDEIFKHYKEKKITVVRAWAYFNKDIVDKNKTAFQLDWNSGINKTALHKLHYVIKKAEEYDLKLIFALTNFEQDFGGMAWYVQKYMEKFEGVKNINLKEDFKKGGKYAYRKIEFYWNPKIKAAYKLYVKSLLNSYNPLTKRLIKNEPSIMGWDLCNEPHTVDNAESKNKGNAAFLWLTEMADYVHSIAPKHLLTTGEEGYMAETKSKTVAPYQWIDDGTKGIDFAKNREIKNIDFLTIHAYPDRWRAKDGDARTALEWGRLNFFKKRADLAKAINKPLVMEEYGYSFRRDKQQSQSENSKIRDAYLRKMHQMANENDMAGMIVWQLLPHKHSYQSHFPKSDDYDISYDWNEDGTQAIYDNAYNLSIKGFKSNTTTTNNSSVITIVNAPASVTAKANKWYKIELNSTKSGSVVIALKDPTDWSTFIYEPRNVKKGPQTFFVETYKTVTSKNKNELLWEVKFNSDKPVTKATSLVSNTTTTNDSSVITIVNAPASVTAKANKWYEIELNSTKSGSVVIALKDPTDWNTFIYEPRNVKKGPQTFFVETYKTVTSKSKNELLWEVKFNSDKPVTKATSLVGNTTISKNDTNPTIVSAPNSIIRKGERSHKVVVKYPKVGRAEISLKNSKNFEVLAKVYKTVNITTAGQVIEHWPWVNKDIEGDINLIWEIKVFDDKNNQIGYKSFEVTLIDGKSARKIESETTVYPLPMNNHLNIISKESVTRIELLDLNGRVVLKRNEKYEAGEIIRLNTSDSGSNKMYYLNLYNNDKKISTTRILRE